MNENAALVLTCDPCSEPFRRATGAIFKGIITRGTVGLRQWCKHCAWCGVPLHIPFLDNETHKGCYLHGAQCPDLLPQGTVQAARLEQHLARLGMGLTDRGWTELGEELFTSGHGGIDMRAVLGRLTEDTGLVSYCQ